MEKLKDFLEKYELDSSPAVRGYSGDDITLDGLLPLLPGIDPATGFRFRDETYLDSWRVNEEEIYKTDDVSVWLIERNGNVVALLSTDIQETCVHVDLRWPQLWWDQESTHAIVAWLNKNGVDARAHEYTETLD